jgi:hypothetical protein
MMIVISWLVEVNQLIYEGKQFWNLRGKLNQRQMPVPPAVAVENA